MFCTIIKDNDLRTLYKYLHQLVEGEIPQYNPDWYESSKQIRDYFRKNITDKEDEYLIDIYLGTLKNILTHIKEQ